jgi:4'-phosphopantetheinyl transferase
MSTSKTTGPCNVDENVQVAPELNPPIGFNITHDNALIAMAFAPGVYNGPAFNVGIDVMKVRLPRQETLSSFVQTVGEQVARHEPRR